MHKQRNRTKNNDVQQLKTTIKKQLPHKQKQNHYQISDDQQAQENERLKLQQENINTNKYEENDEEVKQFTYFNKNSNRSGNIQNLQANYQKSTRKQNKNKHNNKNNNKIKQTHIESQQILTQKTKQQIQIINSIIEDQIHKSNIEHQQNVRINKRLNIVIGILLLFIFGILFVHRFLNIAESQLDNIDHNSKNVKIMQNKNVANNPNQKQKELIQTIKSDINTLAPPILPKQQHTSSSINNEIKTPQVDPIKGITQRNSVNKQVYSKSLDLNDFIIEPVYQDAPQQIKSIFDQMIKRPQNYVTRPNVIFMPTQKAYFAYNIFKNPQNQKYQQAQLYYYQHKYGLSDYKNQLPLCIVAPGRNIAKTKAYMRFIDSVQRQNYSNYRLIYIDDVSDDNSVIELQNYIKQTKGPLARIPQIQQLYQGSFIVNQQQYYKQQTQQRTVIIQNKQRVYALANRNKGIRNYCPQNSIVLDVDADDSLIGRQVFRVVNAIYNNQDVWMFNSVFIYDKSQYKQVTTGPQQGVPLEILEQGNYRTSMIWKTSQLRTFRTQLFNKIDQNDFKQANGTFYKWASDVFTQEPLVQLAGPKHYKHLYQIMYFYDWNFDRTTVYKRRHYRDIAFMQTPYKPLPSLQAKAQKVQNHEIPIQIKRQYQKNIVEARKQAIRYRRQVPF